MNSKELELLKSLSKEGQQLVLNFINDLRISYDKDFTSVTEEEKENIDRIIKEDDFMDKIKQIQDIYDILPKDGQKLVNNFIKNLTIAYTEKDKKKKNK